MPRTSAICFTICASLVSAVGAQCPGERVHSPIRWHYGSFGRSVEVAGEVAIVGDPTDHTFCPGTTCSSGAVHVVRRTGGDWALDTTLYHSRISESDIFGAGISLDGGDRFAAAAPLEDIAGGNAGAIYIFEHDGEAWRETAEILPVEPAWRRGFGGSLVLRGDTLIAGQRDDACWVYRERNGRWEFAQKIPAPPSPSFTWYSDGLAFDGDWLAVGAPQDGQFAHKGGVVHLYRRDGGGDFEFAQLLAPPDPAETANFGWDVDIEGDRLVVGAPIVAEGAGAVFIYQLVEGRWEHAASVHKEPPVRAALGSSVSLHGDTIVAGAPVELLSDTFGAAYVLQRQADGTWRQAAKLLPDDPPSSNFGASVATDGASIIVGAPDETVGGAPQTGAAHIFDLGCLICRADLDGDGELTFFDFLAFQNLFAAGDLRADFDGDGELTFFDFLAFQNEFAAGCE